MAGEGRLKWDQDGQRLYETGTDHGVLYVMNAAGTAYTNGVAWNGLTAVTESPSGAEETALWADNIKYLSLRSAEEFGGTIEAYTYPEEFAECDGSKEVADGVFIGQQTRKKFGFSYRSIIGNDTLGNDYSEKIHVIYGCSINPSERAYSTVNDSPEAATFSWEFSTIAQKGTLTIGGETKEYSAAEITIDCSKISTAAANAIKDKLWGTDPTTGTSASQGSAPTLPDFATFIKFVQDAITDNPIPTT